MGALDLSFFNADLVRNFLWNGFVFSIQLTLVAMVGGIFFGTLLALPFLHPEVLEAEKTSAACLCSPENSPDCRYALAGLMKQATYHRNRHPM